MTLSEKILAGLKVKPATEEQKKRNLKGCLGCLALPFFGIMILALIGLSMPDKEEDHIGATVSYYLQEHAHDPSSVKIETLNVVKQDQPGRNGYVAYVKYRAKNGFGALVLGEAYLEVDSTGKNVVQVISQ